VRMTAHGRGGRGVAGERGHGPHCAREVLPDSGAVPACRSLSPPHHVRRSDHD
jgi:hypothetical protein